MSKGAKCQYLIDALRRTVEQGLILIDMEVITPEELSESVRQITQRLREIILS